MLHICCCCCCCWCCCCFVDGFILLLLLFCAVYLLLLLMLLLFCCWFYFVVLVVVAVFWFLLFLLLLLVLFLLAREKISRYWKQIHYKTRKCCVYRRVFSTFQPGHYTDYGSERVNVFSDYGSERVNVFFFSVLSFCMQATILRECRVQGWDWHDGFLPAPSLFSLVHSSSDVMLLQAPRRKLTGSQ